MIDSVSHSTSRSFLAAVAVQWQGEPHQPILNVGRLRIAEVKGGAPGDEISDPAETQPKSSSFFYYLMKTFEKQALKQ